MTPAANRAEWINVNAQVILIEPTGSNIIPYGVNTSPTLVSFLFT